jgi:hypothetical protein
MILNGRGKGYGKGGKYCEKGMKKLKMRLSAKFR